MILTVGERNAIHELAVGFVKAVFGVEVVSVDCGVVPVNEIHAAGVHLRPDFLMQPYSLGIGVIAPGQRISVSDVGFADDDRLWSGLVIFPNIHTVPVDIEGGVEILVSSDSRSIRIGST